MELDPCIRRCTQCRALRSSSFISHFHHRNAPFLRACHGIISRLCKFKEPGCGYSSHTLLVYVSGSLNPVLKQRQANVIPPDITASTTSRGHRCLFHTPPRSCPSVSEQKVWHFLRLSVQWPMLSINSSILLPWMH